MGVIQHWLLTSVLRVVKYPRRTLVICGIILVACVLLALTRLSIDTDQDKLFSPQVAFFKTYIEYENKFPENEALYVLIQPTDKSHVPPLARWSALADRIAARIGTLKSVVEHVEGRTTISSLGPYALLFQDNASLRQEFQDVNGQLVPLARLFGERPTGLMAAFGGSPIQRFLAAMSLAPADAEKAKFISILADSWTDTIKKHKAQVPDLVELRAQDPGDLGYSYVQDQTDPSNHILLISVYLIDDESSMDSESAQVAAVREAARQEAADFPEFQVAVTGAPALDADTASTSTNDSTRAEIVALIAIFIGLSVALRSIWLAVAAEICLVVAIGWTFGWTTISVGELNILSIVFLITLIGIGMDYLVQILTRYRLEARRYERPAAIWSRVFRHVSPPICTACLGAAGAFFVAVFTDFRGAAELGIIAGGGLLLCLASGYTVLPALLVLFPPKIARVQPTRRYEVENTHRSAVRRLTLPAIWIVLLAIIVPFGTRTYFNPNLLDMQAKNLESVIMVRKLQTWNAVVMSNDLRMLRKVRDAAQTSPLVASTESVLNALDNYTWLTDHKNQLPAIDWAYPAELTQADLTAIATAADFLAGNWSQFPDTVKSLRQFTSALSASQTSPRTQSDLSAWQLSFAKQLRNLLSQFSPPPLDIRRLPSALRNHLVSADGTYALYVWPTEGLWQREPLRRFVTDVEDRIAAIPDHPQLTGMAPHIYHSTKAIEVSFYKATAYALILVLILVMLDLRSIPQTLITVSVLGIGLPMLVGLMGLFGITWNFANFFGLPILIGAGHEYGVFMTHRYREAISHRRRVWTKWDVSDRALLLCAYVTISSFAFFWALGHHQGLKSLGLVMALGTTCIYLAAVMVVRPLLKWNIEKRSK
jgi:predicted RND superfamily exporter protein